MAKNISKSLENPSFGLVFIMTGASFWAIDALFRTQLTYAIPAASIVFFEHLIGFIFLSPIFVKELKKIKSLEKTDWILALLITLFSSVLGTLLFTEALSRGFATYDFATPILLQKLQPVFVILLSAIFLKEKITPRFLGLAVLALIGSYMISFGVEPVKLQLSGKELIYFLSISAAFCWGFGTILSKNLLKKLDYPEATSLRFLLAIPVAFIASLIIKQTYNFANLSFDQVWRFVVISGITGGAGAILIYYKGLKLTEAKISTIAELIFPIVSILIAITSLNPYGEPQTLTLANVFGILILLTSIVLISFEKTYSEKVSSED